MDRHACLAVQSTHTHALIRSTRAKPPHARYKRNKKREKERRHVQGLLTNTRSRPSRRGEGAGVTVQVSFCFRNDARAGNRRKQKTRKVPAHLNNDEEKKKKKKKTFWSGKGYKYICYQSAKLGRRKHVAYTFATCIEPSATS